MTALLLHAFIIFSSPMFIRSSALLLIISLIAMGCDRPSDSDRTTDLDAAVAEIVADYPEATMAVVVIDRETETRFSLNGDTTFHAASMMKVPVMIEVFRQAAEGRFALDDSLTVENRFRSIVDSTEYSIETDSDDGIYDDLGGRMSILDLTRNMITVSSNLATNLLIDYLDPELVQRTTERLGANGVRVLRGVEDLKAFEAGRNNVATANGMAALFEALMEQRAVSPEADSQMIRILIDQQFNSMIPRGLPENTVFAHKTGWITGVHHDGGIVFSTQHEPYVLVVMTRGIRDETESAQVGADIAAAVHAVVRPEQD